jgi:hypothetical protein
LKFENEKNQTDRENHRGVSCGEIAFSLGEGGPPKWWMRYKKEGKHDTI